MKLYEVIDVLLEAQKKYGGLTPVTLYISDDQRNRDGEGRYSVEDILADEHSITLYNF